MCVGRQVQNKKLSERLKERNFAREQLEARVEEAENRVEEQRLALASLPRHLQALRDHLTPFLPGHVTLDGLERVWGEARPELVLDEGFRCVFAALRQLQCGENSGPNEIPAVEGLSETQIERDKLQDETSALQGRCEELENTLADTRYISLPTPVAPLPTHPLPSLPPSLPPSPPPPLSHSLPPWPGLTWSAVCPVFCV